MAEVEKTYTLENIMRRRKRDDAALKSKIAARRAVREQLKRPKEQVVQPHKLIEKYRHEQKAYSYFKMKKVQTERKPKGEVKAKDGYGKLLLVVRVRGVLDISLQQRTLLKRLRLGKVNSAVFMRGTVKNLRFLEQVQNYITWGEPSRQTVRSLITKKFYANVGGQPQLVQSNELIEQHLGGDVLCTEDVINEVFHVGANFKRVNEFIYPFKLVTPENTLMSKIRKPVEDGGHWGYRGEDINTYVQHMI